MGSLIPGGLNLRYLDEEKLRNIGNPLMDLPLVFCILQGVMSDDFMTEAIYGYLCSMYQKLVMTEEEVYDYLVILKNSFSFSQERKEKVVHDVAIKFGINKGWKTSSQILLIFAKNVERARGLEIWDFNPPALLFDPRRIV